MNLDRNALITPLANADSAAKLERERKEEKMSKTQNLRHFKTMNGDELLKINHSNYNYDQDLPNEDKEVGEN